MGCCGDNDEDDPIPILTQPLNPVESSTDISAETPITISPMNSHFSALTCRDTLRLIFEKLPWWTWLGRAAFAGCGTRWRRMVMDIKRLNNMMSDHGIHSRERLLIPISNPEILMNGTCYIELDTYAKREVAVLYLEGEPDRKLRCLSNWATSDRGKRRVLDSLKRSMQVDDGTAQYYLSISNGDPRAAITELSADLKWERQAGLG
ncbi:hypothetical protein GH714_042245 [Hevea brasiliensis]|uniref:Uncharacterized protein n=1 Tax=Hevea brasiliensis TaxID=3981 RepID=A0A6A6MUP6_HEVBR|nr:hypothetical protein GH714_042245 [Hevea brasiliensis]